MQRIWRTLRTLDDLAEVALVATWKGMRRRRVALTVGTLGLVAYLGSGFVLTPTQALDIWGDTVHNGEIAPLAALSEPGLPSLETDTLLRDPTWDAGEIEQVRTFLAPHGAVLESGRESLGDGPVVFSRTPNYRRLRALSQALVLEGRLRASEGRSEEAATSLVAALRVGTSVRRGLSGKGPLWIEGMIGVAIAREASRGIESTLDSETLTPRALETLRRELARWSEQALEAEEMARTETRELRRILAGWVETGGLPPLSGYPSWGVEDIGARLVLPLTREGREEFARGLVDRMEGAYQAQLEWARDPGDGNRTLDEAVGLEFPGLLTLLQSPFSREAGLEVASQYLFSLWLPNIAKAVRRIEAFQNRVVELRLRLAEEQLSRLR